MRVLFFGNNWVGWQILKWLSAQDNEIVGLVLHPPGNRRYGEEILQALESKVLPVFDGTRLREPETIDEIRDLKPDIGISALFGYILKPAILDLMPAGCINVHPALLPYNRGAHPNVWSIVEETPAGATIHYINAGVDTGDIIAQSEIVVEPIDTGATLYKKLEEACVELFKRAWPLIRAGQAPRRKQPAGAGTHHFIRDVDKLDEIDLDRHYSAHELINILRARTFPPYQGAYFCDGNRKVYLRLELYYDDD